MSWAVSVGCAGSVTWLWQASGKSWTLGLVGSVAHWPGACLDAAGIKQREGRRRMPSCCTLPSLVPVYVS